MFNLLRPSRDEPSLLLGTRGGGFFPTDVRLDQRAMAAHKHLMGITGVGKSRLLQAMFLQLLEQRVGVSLIDPHRDLARGILASLVESEFFGRAVAWERLIYLDFARPEPIPFNVLRTQPNLRSHDVAYAFVEAVKRAWPSIAGGSAPLLENILLAGTAALVEAGEPITRLQALLTDEEERNSILRRVRDPGTMDFFRDRFERWGGRSAFLAESTLRRLFLLTFAPELRGPLGHVENVINVSGFMDAGTAVIYDLGAIRNPEARRLLGCLITVGYELAALGRAQDPSGRRRPHHLLVDEFGEFVAQSGEALERMLVATRKYGLSVTLAHQTWSQASQRLRGALQNCGVKVFFRLGHADAELMAPEVSAASRGTVRQAWAERLQRLPARQAVVLGAEREVTEMTSVWTPSSGVPSRQVERVADEYARRYHREHNGERRSGRDHVDPHNSQAEEGETGSHFRGLWS